jgi:protein phosphatase
MAQQKSRRRSRKALAIKNGHRQEIISKRADQFPNKRSFTGDERVPFTFASASVACERHPLRNEDTILTEKRSCLAAVFDGVGGSAAGEIASQTAARATLHGWRRVRQQLQKGYNARTLLKDCNKADVCVMLEQIIAKADELVRTEGAERAGTDDLATTVALVTFCKDSTEQGYMMIYSHVGDSRIYLLRENEPLKRLTVDDGLLGRLVENALVSEEDALRIDQAMHAEQLTDVELSYFRLRGGITQALGGPLPPTIHVDSTPVYPGDRILLCTDGIHDNLTDAEIGGIVRTAPRFAIARLLVERAIERSRQERSETIRAKPDDISAIVLTCRF